MRTFPRIPLLSLLFLACAAGALPEVTITPPPGARFLPGQRFDVRVEGKGTGPFSATLELDGAPVAFSSGAQGTRETDGITADGYGGFDRRGFSLQRPGVYTLRATFSDAGGTGTASSRIEVVDVSRLAPAGGARNVVFLLGDGMGAGHRAAARIAGKGVEAGDPRGWLAMDEMPGTGLVTTHSRDRVVTDSAAGMAAYSTGNHSANGQAGVFPAHVTDPFLAPRVEYLGAFLHRTRGTSLGIVTTADVADASPTAMAVHTADRNAGSGIADQFLDESGSSKEGSGLRVLMGGGRRWLVPASDPLSARTAATDYRALPGDLAAAWGARGTGALDPGRDLLGDFRRRGFAVVSTSAELSAATSAGAPERLLGTFAPGNMTPALDARTTAEPTLEAMTRAALAVLTRDGRPFFLMVEGALIDKESHAADAERMIAEVLELDRAVAAALDFARRDGRTLVIVAADHENAGFSAAEALAGGLASGVHTAADVPISAYAREERAWRPFLGVQRNVDVFFKMAAVLGVE